MAGPSPGRRPNWAASIPPRRRPAGIGPQNEPEIAGPRHRSRGEASITPDRSAGVELAERSQIMQWAAHAEDRFWSRMQAWSRAGSWPSAAHGPSPTCRGPHHGYRIWQNEAKIMNLFNGTPTHRTSLVGCAGDGRAQLMGRPPTAIGQKGSGRTKPNNALFQWARPNDCF